MAGLSLDDTLHAVVQVTHEHGLPLHGVNVHPGDVQVFTDAGNTRWWVRWLTDPAAATSRFTVWRKESEIGFHISARREGIEWIVATGVPATVAEPVLTAQGVTVTTRHLAVPAAAANALADAYATHAGDPAGNGPG